MKAIKNNIIVIGTNHYNTLGVIRSLGEKDIPVILILVSEKEVYVSKSKYVTQTWLVNKSENEIMNLLLSNFNFNDEEHKPIIIPTSDFVVRIIDKYLKVLKDKYILPNINGEEGEITKLMNKMKMNKLAEEVGLRVPKSWEVVLNGLNDKIKSICEKVVYPCIVKPLCSTEGKKEDIVICKNRMELTDRLSNFKGYKKVLIQEYISGQDCRMIEIIGCVTPNTKEIIIPGIIEKIREYPLMAGSTSYALVSRNSKLININEVYRLLNELGYTGLFDIEFKYADGKTYFIEFNFRNGAPAYALTKTGVNVPYIWYLEVIGGDTSKINKKIIRDFRFMMEARDFNHVINGDVKLSSWLMDLIRTRAFLFINFRDMKPWISKLLGSGKKLCKVG